MKIQLSSESSQSLKQSKFHPQTRKIECNYQDPLDLIWLNCVAQFGWRVQRSDEVFASWDGAGLLSISTPKEMDSDDTLAQMIFHEICHALIEGEESMRLPDWGLENTNDQDIVNEFACHRLQATLAGQYDLRSFLAVTTDWRFHYDQLPTDPLSEPQSAHCYSLDLHPFDLHSLDLHRAAIEMAKFGLERSERAPWHTPLHTALSQTSLIRSIISPLSPTDSLWSSSSLNSN